jgi:translation initiation factor IF-2
MKGFVPPPRLALSNEPLPITRSITIGEGISVKDLAEKLSVRAKDLIARLLMKGVMATVNQSLDFEPRTWRDILALSLSRSALKIRQRRKWPR